MFVFFSVFNVSWKSGVWCYGIVYLFSKKFMILCFFFKIVDCFFGSRLEVFVWFCFFLYIGLVGLVIFYVLLVRDWLLGMVMLFIEMEK